MDPKKFCNLVYEVSGRVISTEQAKAFLEIFENELEEDVNIARRIFIKRHFGKR